MASERVAVLYGGDSSEREVSLNSGRAVYEALLAKGVDATLIDTRGDLISKLTASPIDKAFIALHGKGGEDGQIQALLELLDIPYTGSNVSSSAIAMDKLKCKQLWAAAGLAITPYLIIDAQSDWSEVSGELGEKLVVKPASEGSSVGVSLVSSRDEFDEARALALSFGGTVIVEKFQSGREFTVGVLGRKSLPSIQLIAANDFYDYAAKYEQDDTKYLIPSQLTEEQEQWISATALEAFELIGCSGWGRVDFIESEDGEIQLMEINTVPGMTSHSLVPMGAAALGIDFESLCVEILNGAVSGDK